MYDIAIQIWAWYWLYKVWKLIWEKLIKKFWKKVAVKLWSKAIPFVWRWLTTYTVLTAWEENVEYFNYCSEIKSTPNWKLPSYYCGVLTVNGILISWWIWISHLSPVWKFKSEFIKKNWEKARANKDAFIKYWGLSSKLKPIKSFDSHIFTDHVYWANNTKSKFLQWADIKAIIREWYAKNWKKNIRNYFRCKLKDYKEFINRSRYVKKGMN